jgi:hypothetical protein
VDDAFCTVISQVGRHSSLWYVAHLKIYWPRGSIVDKRFVQCAVIRFFFFFFFSFHDFFFFFFFQNIGLQYEDLLVETAAVDEALRRLPHAALVARDQRIKRAFDLSHKKVYLPVHQQSDPLRQTHIVRKLVKEVQQEFDERAAFRK